MSGGSDQAAAGVFLGLGLLLLLEVLQQLLIAALYVMNLFRAWQADLLLFLLAVSAAALLASVIELMRARSVEPPGTATAVQAARNATPRTWAIVALAAQVAPGILPIQPGDRFLFLTLGSVRIAISWYLALWSIAIVIGIGLLVLARGWEPAAAGVSLGLGLLVSLRVLARLIDGASDHLSTAYRHFLYLDIDLGLQVVSAAALLVSAIMLMREGSEVPRGMRGLY